MGRWFWSVSLIAVLAAFAWFVAAAPTIVSAAVAIVIACGFSVWLDGKAEGEGPSGERRDSKGTTLLVRQQDRRLVR
jgi:hypothetical protein